MVYEKPAFMLRWEKRNDLLDKQKNIKKEDIKINNYKLKNEKIELKNMGSDEESWVKKRYPHFAFPPYRTRTPKETQKNVKTPKKLSNADFVKRNSIIILICFLIQRKHTKTEKVTKKRSSYVTNVIKNSQHILDSKDTTTTKDHTNAISVVYKMIENINRFMSS